MESKKARSRNFTEKEKTFLFDIVTSEQFKSIIENKNTDGVSVAKKNLAWQEIAQRYNFHAETGNRAPKQLHNLYDMLKKKARSDSSTEKKNAHKTGGGTFVPNGGPLGDKIVFVLKPQFTPLTNQYDSSADYLMSEPSSSSACSAMNVMHESLNIDNLKVEPEELLTNDTESEEDIDINISSIPASPSPPPFIHHGASTSKRKRPPDGNPLHVGPKSGKEAIDLITKRFVNRKNAKDLNDQEVQSRKLQILDVEKQLKIKQLEVIEQELQLVEQKIQHDREFFEINMKARLDEIEFEKKLRESKLNNLNI